MIPLDDYLAKYIHEWPDEILPSTGYDSEEGVYIYVSDDNNRNNKLEPLALLLKLRPSFLQRA